MLTYFTRNDRSDFTVDEFANGWIALSEETKRYLCDLAEKSACDESSVNSLLRILIPNAPLMTEWAALYAMNELSREYLRVLRELEVATLSRWEIAGLFGGLVGAEFQALSAHKFTEENPYVFLRLFFVGVDEGGKGKVGVVEADYDSLLDLEKSIENFDRYYHQTDPGKRIMFTIFPDFAPHIHYVAGNVVSGIGRKDIYTCLLDAFVAAEYQKVSVSKGLDQLEQAILFVKRLFSKS